MTVEQVVLDLFDESADVMVDPAATGAHQMEVLVRVRDLPMASICVMESAHSRHSKLLEQAERAVDRCDIDVITNALGKGFDRRVATEVEGIPDPPARFRNAEAMLA